MNKSSVYYIVAVVLGVVLAVAAIAAWPRHPQPAPGLPSGSFMTNEARIKGLYTNANMLDPKEAFRRVFDALDEEVVMYPSENALYFRVAVRGKLFDGAFHFDRGTADSAALGFSYAVIYEDRMRGRGKVEKAFHRVLGPADTVYVEPDDSSGFVVTYMRKRVHFIAYRIAQTVPATLKLLPSEKLVGNTFDESGLRFHLVYNTNARRLYWLLNEEGFVPEEFETFGTTLAIGMRTEFAFYRDSVSRRMLLIGVNAYNVGANNWYDGPFDHLPDNEVHAGRLDLRTYIATHLGIDPSKLNKYGGYVGRESKRAAVTPYTIYSEPSQLGFVDSLLALKKPVDEFLAAATEPRVFIPPASAEAAPIASWKDRIPKEMLNNLAKKPTTVPTLKAEH